MRRTADLLSRTMTARGLDDSRLAVLVGVSVPTVHAWRLGTALPRVRRVAALAAALGLDAFAVHCAISADLTARAQRVLAQRTPRRVAEPPGPGYDAGRR